MASAQGESHQGAPVMSASGQLLQSSNNVLVTCMGQPGATRITRGGTYVNYGGFLAGAPLRGHLDTDGDGLPDELDDDNDNDGLSDEEEITGSPWFPASVSSNPNLADTDNDGARDYEEAVAGTDPGDPSHFLAVEVTPEFLHPAGMRVAWTARHGKAYRLYRLDNLVSFPGTQIHSVTHANAAPAPFFAGTEEFLDTGAPFTRSYYLVEVLP